MGARKRKSKDKTVVEIKGVKYFTLDDVAAAVGRTRVTIWRWRQERVIPAGHRDIRRRVLFTSSEVDAIREHALRVEPILPEDQNQLTLFNNANRRALGGNT